MSKMQRDKGRRGELEVAELLRDQGFQADLIYGQEEVGGRHGDLDTDLGFIEVRRRAGLAKDLRPNEDLWGLVAWQDAVAGLVGARAAAGVLGRSAGLAPSPRRHGMYLPRYTNRDCTCSNETRRRQCRRPT